MNSADMEHTFRTSLTREQQLGAAEEQRKKESKKRMWSGEPWEDRASRGKNAESCWKVEETQQHICRRVSQLRGGSGRPVGHEEDNSFVQNLAGRSSMEGGEGMLIVFSHKDLWAFRKRNG
jgi:hypothetical protein